MANIDQWHPHQVAEGRGTLPKASLVRDVPQEAEGASPKASRLLVWAVVVEVVAMFAG